GELLFAPIRAEVLQRVRTTAVDEVSIAPAELGTWAGAIGAAVHGAEQAGEADAADARADDVAEVAGPPAPASAAASAAPAGATLEGTGR
ncbi:MAG TPA: hypothetical protein VFP22_09540, partial [Candidatus Limnocylindrales bacterium]|nr:hypothetical protein [Candidatus Limnocylindrales bacterium]